MCTGNPTQYPRADTDACATPAVPSGVTGGGQSVPPETSDREISADVSGKKRGKEQREKVKIEKKRWKIGNRSRKTL